MKNIYLEAKNLAKLVLKNGSPDMQEQAKALPIPAPKPSKPSEESSKKKQLYMKNVLTTASIFKSNFITMFLLTY